VEVSANMARYIAFLRGVNISGKNKVPMAELKKGFEEMGFSEVRTYLNSGNVIFSSDEGNIEGFTNQSGRFCAVDGCDGISHPTGCYKADSLRI